MNIGKLFISLIWIYSSLAAQLNFELQAQLSNNTWNFPLLAQAQISDNLSLFQTYVFTHINHPTDRYKWFTYSHGNNTFYNDEGFFRYYNKKMELTIGRNYTSIGYGRMSGLFLSPVSPSLDQITLNIRGISNFNFRNSIIRLDNRSKVWGGNEKVAHRWYYLRSIGYNYKDKVKINLFDAVIATGFNRGLEWYYVNPLSSLFMERKHQYHWGEGSDTSTVIGRGDNDNHFVGGSINISIKQWEILGEILIDEWQLTYDYRDNMQTVFGVMFGTHYYSEKLEFAIEYSYASPWLYLNRALYGGLEQHYQPLGLRSPQSHAVDFSFEIFLSKTKSLLIQSHLGERGNQTLSTIWNAWDTKIDHYDFFYTLPLEWKIIYKDNENKFFNTVSFYHQWLGYKHTLFVLSKSWSIKI
jgi:hypothetical protein